MKRSFLFLQGPCTPFFSQLAQRLVAEGHAVNRLHFCGGDVAYWLGRAGGRRFSANLADLPEVLAELERRHGVTDLVLFGDQRGVHRPALAHARQHHWIAHVFEEGYFRPWWVTLERGGVNALSALPKAAAWYSDTAARLPVVEGPEPFQSHFHVRAFHDVVYHLASALNPIMFPTYQTHAPVSAPAEYAGYIRRFIQLQRFRKQEERKLAHLIGSGQPFFFLPLQLNGDAQIREHSRFADMAEVIEHVMDSFARHAPPDCLLAIKNHPLDMGLMPFARIIADAERRYGVEGRTVYLEQADLGALVSHARGVVTVNSTVGMVSLELGRPTLTLAEPVYGVDGLIDPQPLDDFWHDPRHPDDLLFAAFKKVVLHTTQLNGGFYGSDGRALAVKHAIPALLAKRSVLEEWL